MDTLANNSQNHHESASAHRILEAALALFAEKGFDAASIREICEAAEITRPTLYYFYQSKEGLYRAAIEHVMWHCDQSTKEARTGSQSLNESMKKAMRGLFADVTERTQMWRLAFQIIWSRPHPIAKSVLEEFHTKWNEEIAADLEKAVESGEVSPGDARARTLVYMGTIGECIGNYMYMGRPELTPELADSLVDTIFSGWAPRNPKTKKLK